MKAAPLTLAAVVTGVLGTMGCLNDHLYMDPGENMGGGGFYGANGAAAMRGDVGTLVGFDNMGRDISFYADDAHVGFSGNVPHQNRFSSVFIDVQIENPGALPIGASLEQQGTAYDQWDVVDDSGAPLGDAAILNVYICPNGEGESGDADHIIVTRTGQESFTFTATSRNPGQNLNVDVAVASEREVAVLQNSMWR